MEAYRRLAAVTDQADVDDVRTEWLDRYGPLPPTAEALLAVARLRAECVRVRATSVSVQKGVARIEGLELKESQKVRLRGGWRPRRRPRRTARWRSRSRSGPRGPDALVALLRELIPVGSRLRSPRGRVIAARAGRVPIPVKRTFSLLVAVISAAALLSACSSTGGPVAAKVDSTTISRGARRRAETR